MKLTTKIAVQKIRVIADYQRKENNPMFSAILRYALGNYGIPTIEGLRNHLSGNGLNHRMWENILRRLMEQGYFSEKNGKYWFDSTEKYYELTDFGKEAASQDMYFKSMKGALEVWIVKERIDWLPHQIVKIEEVNGSREEIENERNTSKFKLPLEQILTLKNGAFRFEKIEPKCEIIEEVQLGLTITASDKGGKVSLEELEFSKTDFSRQQLTNSFLTKNYKRSFLKSKQLIRTAFDGNIQFKRDVHIKEPIVGETTFQSITLNNIHFMAKTEHDAEQWRLKWMRVNIRDYIFENDEFAKKADEIWKKFEPHFKLSLLTIPDFENYLKQDEKNNFYSLMYLQAPQLLTY